MKDIKTILLTIFLVIISLIFRGNMLILENYLPVELKGTVSVYYDLSGKPYIYVDDYVRKDGTFVKGYYRSLPDKDKFNNWSTKGNCNPFTGKKGYEKP